MLQIEMATKWSEENVELALSAMKEGLSLHRRMVFQKARSPCIDLANPK